MATFFRRSPSRGCRAEACWIGALYASIRELRQPFTLCKDSDSAIRRQTKHCAR
jgi:hypothetical protein